MSPRIVANIFLLTTLAVTVCSVKFPQYCSDCEEEAWEEVPCDEITTLSTTTTTTAYPIITTMAPTTPPPTTPYITPAPAELYMTPTESTTTTSRPVTAYKTTSVPYTKPGSQNAAGTSDTYKKCYCECKQGCKDFCRKVIADVGHKEQITQMTQTVHNMPDGNVEMKHTHQRKFLPATDGYIKSSPYSNSIVREQQQQYQNRYQQQVYQKQAESLCSAENSVDLNNIHNLPKSLYPAVSVYSDAGFASSLYSVEELIKHLQSENPEKSIFATSSTILQPKYQAIPSNTYGTTIGFSDSKAPMYATLYGRVPLSELKISSNYGSSKNFPKASSIVTSGSFNSNYIEKNPYFGGLDPYKPGLTTAHSDGIDGYFNEYFYAESAPPNYASLKSALPLKY